MAFHPRGTLPANQCNQFVIPTVRVTTNHMIFQPLGQVFSTRLPIGGYQYRFSTLPRHYNGIPLPIINIPSSQTGQTRVTSPSDYTLSPPHSPTLTDELGRHPELTRQPTLYRCVECDFETHAYDQLYLHSWISHQKRLESCKVCKYRTSSANYMQLHRVLHTDRCKCHVCGYDAENFSDFQRHQTTHDDENLALCEFCSYRTNEEETMQGHRNRHTALQNKRFPCGYCKFSYSTLRALDRHTLLCHTGQFE